MEHDRMRVSDSHLRGTYLIFFQAAQLGDETGEGVFSWNGWPIGNEGIFGHKTKGDKACDGD